MPARRINDEPWPPDLYPLSVRGIRPSDGEWLHGSEALITPAVGVWYETREPVRDEWVRLDRYATQVNLLVPPGTYTVEFRGAARGDATVTAIVDDPFTQLEYVDVDGKPFRVRRGTWDEYILKEHSYAKLEIKPADVVADLGAHVGVFARRALAAGASVVCWEPEPFNAMLLRENLGLAGGDSLVVEGCVVSDEYEAETVRLWVDSAGDGDMGRTALHSIVRGKGARLARRVPAFRWLSELERVRPTVLKVDVEGAELTYDWSRVPESVREIAVEVELAKKKLQPLRKQLRSDLLALGFELVSESNGWSSVQIYRRPHV